MILRAARPGTRATLFLGVPTGDASLPGGPFVASSKDQLRAFGEAYRSGRMGRLEPFDQDEFDRRYDAHHREG